MWYYNNMKKIIMLLVMGCASCYGQNAELDALKQKYDNAIAQAVAPINQVYEIELQKMLEKFSKAKNIEGMENVTALLKSVKKDTDAINNKTFIDFMWKTPTGTTFSFINNGTGYRQYGSDITPIKWQKIGTYIKASGKENTSSDKTEWFFTFSNGEGMFGTDKNNINKKLQRNDR
jgi:hypothetical protein